EAEGGIRDDHVAGVQTCALPILLRPQGKARCPMSAVLGGTQSLHSNAMDEVFAIPTDRAARLALRTQQLIAFETGVGSTIDPLRSEERRVGKGWRSRGATEHVKT